MTNSKKIAEHLGGGQYGIAILQDALHYGGDCLSIDLKLWFERFKRSVPNADFEIYEYAVLKSKWFRGTSSAHGVMLDMPKSADEFINTIKKRYKASINTRVRRKRIEDLGQDNLMHVSFKMTKMGVMVRLYKNRECRGYQSLKMTVVPLHKTNNFFSAKELAKRDDWMGEAVRRLMLLASRK